jgi:hypothetical protein
MNELDLKEDYRPVYLFLRADERAQSIEAELHDTGLKIQSIENNLNNMDKRINLGIAITGQNNQKTLSEMITRVTLLEKENGELEKKLFDKDTGLLKQFENINNWINMINKTMAGFFIMGVFGALILWALSHF